MIYEPREDSILIGKFVKEYSRGKVLDIGSGSGYLAEIALEKTKDVLAADINPEAVEHCKKKGINSIVSDLFSNIKGKFDLIIFNPPYLPEDPDEDEESKIITTDKGIIERFLKELKEHLNKNGKCLMIYSSLSPVNPSELAKKNGFSVKILKEEALFFENLYVILIETLHKN
ncbi:MAG: methyltransferase [Candidatus Nanoarchaeia archaeon]|nr:methyltransferase [Candidatus Nanoarchaeia archaeon]